MDYYRIGQRIRKYRKACDYFKEKLAEMIGKSVIHLCHIKIGDSQMLNPSHFQSYILTVFMVVSAAVIFCGCSAAPSRIPTESKGVGANSNNSISNKSNDSSSCPTVIIDTPKSDWTTECESNPSDNYISNTSDTSTSDTTDNSISKDTDATELSNDYSVGTESTDESDLTDTSDVTESFYIEPISDELFEKIYRKSYKEDCPVSLDDLRYVHILHKNLDNDTLEGELICNKEIADAVLDIFKQLYDASYPIEKVRLIDEYDADDESSMADNNSSCFNYRVVSGTTKISRHGLGMAVDINPLYNPYIHTLGDNTVVEPANSLEYVNREDDFPYKITHDDLAYKLFTSYGFTWGGDWKNSKDYQHFQKD